MMTLFISLLAVMYQGERLKYSAYKISTDPFHKK